MPGFSWIEGLRQDAGFASRSLRKAPGFAIIAILTLALGIGANTAIFSIFHAVLLRPLPFHDPDRVMLLSEKIPRRGVNRSDLCAANFFDLQQRSQSFEVMAMLSGRSFALAGNLATEHVAAEQVSGALVSASFFSVLGVSPDRGRTFRSEDEDAGGPSVAILSYRLWQRRFAGDDSILGKTIYLNGRAHQVAGIMPRGFQALFYDHELWVPMQLTAAERSNRSSHYLWAVGRLKSGIARQQAQAELDTIGRSLEREYPDANTGRGLRVAPLHDELIGETRPALVLLMGAVTLVLLVSCVNVANLLLARALGRRREIAIRSALGAGRPRLLQQLVTEGLLLAMVGIGAGLLLAWLALRSLPLLIPASSSLPGLDHLVIDGPVFAVAVTSGVCVSGLFACAPAWQLLKSSAGTLSERAPTAGVGSAPYTLRSVLLAIEVAFSLVLLLGAGLLVRSFNNLVQVQPGFRADHVLTVQLQMPAQQVLFFRQIEQRLRAIHDVEDVAAIEYPPLSGSGITRRMLVEGRPRPEPGGEPIVQRHLVTPDYFLAMGIPLRSGRAFRELDMNAKHLTVVINETMARRFWPNQNPVGQYLRLGVQAAVASAMPREIVGVAGDVRHSSLRLDPRDEVYVPLGQDDWPVLHLVIRTRSEPASLIPDVKAAVWAVDKNQTLPVIKPMAKIAAESVWQPRLNTVVLTGFAIVALALALAGIYGLMMRIVSDRTSEIGIRMAMGARPRSVLLLVLRQGSLPVVVGSVAGLGLGLAGGRFVATQLYGITQADPATFAASVALIVTAAFLAMARPALRATRVDPMAALRHE